MIPMSLIMPMMSFYEQLVKCDNLTERSIVVPSVSDEQIQDICRKANQDPTRSYNKVFLTNRIDGTLPIMGERQQGFVCYLISFI